MTNEELIRAARDCYSDDYTQCNMNRLTEYSERGYIRVYDTQACIKKLARYEDTGLEPDEVEAAKEIAARLALADYPHNFQGERSDIVSYMRWITSVMKEAKAWWGKLLEAREDAEKALEGMDNDER